MRKRTRIKSSPKVITLLFDYLCHLFSIKHNVLYHHFNYVNIWTGSTCAYISHSIERPTLHKRKKDRWSLSLKSLEKKYVFWIEELLFYSPMKVSQIDYAWNNEIMKEVQFRLFYFLFVFIYFVFLWSMLVNQNVQEVTVLVIVLFFFKTSAEQTIVAVVIVN